MRIIENLKKNCKILAYLNVTLFFITSFFIFFGKQIALRMEEFILVNQKRTRLTIQLLESIVKLLPINIDYVLPIPVHKIICNLILNFEKELHFVFKNGNDIEKTKKFIKIFTKQMCSKNIMHPSKKINSLQMEIRWLTDHNFSLLKLLKLSLYYFQIKQMFVLHTDDLCLPVNDNYDNDLFDEIKDGDNTNFVLKKTSNVFLTNFINALKPTLKGLIDITIDVDNKTKQEALKNSLDELLCLNNLLQNFDKSKIQTVNIIEKLLTLQDRLIEFFYTKDYVKIQNQQLKNNYAYHVINLRDFLHITFIKQTIQKFIVIEHDLLSYFEKLTIDLLINMKENKSFLVKEICKSISTFSVLLSNEGMMPGREAEVHNILRLSENGWNYNGAFLEEFHIKAEIHNEATVMQYLSETSNFIKRNMPASNQKINSSYSMCEYLNQPNTSYSFEEFEFIYEDMCKDRKFLEKMEIISLLNQFKSIKIPFVIADALFLIWLCDHNPDMVSNYFAKQSRKQT